MYDASRPGTSVETAWGSLSRLRAPRQIILCGVSHRRAARRNATNPEGRLISRPAMKAPRAWVAQLGQRRSVEVAVPQGFAGSNPAPRIFLRIGRSRDNDGAANCVGEGDFPVVAASNSC